MIRANTLADLSGVQHRFFTRQGGVSAGLYSSLNCGYGSGDEPDNVRENRRRAAACFDHGAEELLTLYQIHSTDVLTVAGERWTSPGAPKADALVTDRPGVVLGVLAADCAPVLLADPEARVIGAAHAGWKGALTGVIESTVGAMEKLGAERANVVAAIGPLIRQQSYEVGNEFVERFMEAGAENALYFLPAAREGHAMFDLAAFIRKRLDNAGVLMIDDTGLDTYSDERFFSYRRSVHRKEADYGRHVHAIVLESSP
jgi:polyphenol oxidase